MNIRAALHAYSGNPPESYNQPESLLSTTTTTTTIMNMQEVPGTLQSQSQVLLVENSTQVLPAH